ncbi:hypothetical protein ACJIZ3_001493 [Penstemon smallii]|uniref:SAM domain-containing protein n=1 Tax=Penstemon smallii TaxID=265156 RepID=A0ABD3U6M4_9LAMI
MAPNPSSNFNIIPTSSSSTLSQLQHTQLKLTSPVIDDDFQDYNPSSISTSTKKPKRSKPTNPPGKENIFPGSDLCSGLDSIEPTLDFLNPKSKQDYLPSYNSIESKLVKHHINSEEEEQFCGEEEEGSTQLDVLLKLCDDVDESEVERIDSIYCPLCGADISELTDDLRQIHTNNCLDKLEGSSNVASVNDAGGLQCPGQIVDGSPLKSNGKVADVSPVVEWLRKLGLSKYEEVFVKEEIDWDALQWLKEEDLCSIGITALGPRKKIVHALGELRNDLCRTVEIKEDVSKGVADETKLGKTKLITDYFQGPLSERKKGSITSTAQNIARRSHTDSAQKSVQGKGRGRNGKQKDVPLWCSIPGTTFRVDAFKYLRRDCSHWFLTHFHLDHYQGLTRSFCHGMIYCSSITAKLINMKIGIPWDKIQVLPLNQKINIAGIDVTCFDANHCPGAIIILFEPPNGKVWTKLIKNLYSFLLVLVFIKLCSSSCIQPVLHSGDFRFGEEMAKLPPLQACRVHTLILDTTYCDPQYDFPKQDSVIQFVIDAVQAEAFNPKTLFLIGSYTIGKERLFIEVARTLRKKVYVTAPKLRILECLGLQQEDMRWFTLNEQESHIHVVPMWTIASFKRLKHMSNQYTGRFSLIVAFSPTGWSFGKGKKSTGRRWQQGTIIRYEVPYSEHSSFTELREFVKLISPANIIPSVNNHGPDSHSSMVSQLLA